MKNTSPQTLNYYETFALKQRESYSRRYDALQLIEGNILP